MNQNKPTGRTRDAAHRLALSMRLTGDDIAAIERAVRAAEAGTSGEIAIAITPESADYSFRELFSAVVAGALAFALTLPFHARIVALLDGLVWHLPPWYATAVCGAGAFLVIALFYRFANVSAVDRLVVPKAERSRAVYRRALRHFLESGIYATAERTGILIFISRMEREVRILADSGISGKIEQSVWDGLAESIARAVKEGTAGQELVRAVETCGSILADHFPAKRDNPNELTDAIAFLEAGE